MKVTANDKHSNLLQNQVTYTLVYLRAKLAAYTLSARHYGSSLVGIKLTRMEVNENYKHYNSQPSLSGGKANILHLESS
jgi:hypothetical protein